MEPYDNFLEYFGGDHQIPYISCLGVLLCRRENRDVDVFKFEVQVCVPDCTDQRICDKAYFQMNGEFVGTDAADYHCGENDCKNGAACHYLTKFFEYFGLRGFR